MILATIKIRNCEVVKQKALGSCVDIYSAVKEQDRMLEYSENSEN